MVNIRSLATFCGLLALGQAYQKLPKWLPEGAPSDGSAPWGSKSLVDSHPTTDMPDTGVTRKYELTLTKGTLNPDGVDRPGILINGQFPGPLIEANWGDWIEVTVCNNMDEGTSIHYHGMNMKGTPWFDGVPFTSQCPVAPGASHTSKFRADEIGSTWYHTHFSASYSGGAVGPLVIHGPVQVDYDVDYEPILVQDWYHGKYQDLVAQVVQDNVANPNVTRPHAEANLVGGLGVYPCANVTNGAACNGGKYSELEFEPGKKYRLRFVNTGSLAFEQISIDGHSMEVIAYDFVPIQPYTTNLVTIGVGQRVDVVVTATGKEGEAYWLRAFNDPLCGDDIGPDGRAKIFYTNADKSQTIPENPTPIPPNKICANEDLSKTVPLFVEPVKDPEATIYITATTARNGSGSIAWELNGVQLKADLSDPILPEVMKGNWNFPPERQVYNLGSNSTVRIIFANTFLTPHAMHLHGHDFQILSEGRGPWDGSIVNPQNPMRRDVQMNHAGANATNPAIGANHLVLQFDLDNPGVWFFHCHLSWHLSAGMGLAFVERPDDLYNMKLPQAISDTCSTWADWQKTHVVDQIDAARYI